MLLLALFFYLLDFCKERSDEESSDHGEARRTVTHPPLVPSAVTSFHILVRRFRLTFRGHVTIQRQASLGTVNSSSNDRYWKAGAVHWLGSS